DSLAVDKEVSVTVDPYRDPLECKVVRVGDEFEPAPENIKRYYSEGQKLLPVILQPNDDCARWMALRVGGVVKLPHRSFPFADRRLSGLPMLNRRCVFPKSGSSPAAPPRCMRVAPPRPSTRRLRLPVFAFPSLW